MLVTEDDALIWRRDKRSVPVCVWLGEGSKSGDFFDVIFSPAAVSIGGLYCVCVGTAYSSHSQGEPGCDCNLTWCHTLH